ncbi:hypothetical protein ACFW2X_11115 [Streptomyces antibioticus]|uniref:hypothetical protein n=1 Tax=Streptomyces antibioticus TaxID=1890 RepID=UPI0036C2B15C
MPRTEGGHSCGAQRTDPDPQAAPTPSSAVTTSGTVSERRSSSPVLGHQVLAFSSA